ncbi:MAG TPA: hypothetical protein VEQ60_30560 [Longimicrobium sp.]|nr:hypothetical protein [Longimicrobium sp.]
MTIDPINPIDPTTEDDGTEYTYELNPHPEPSWADVFEGLWNWATNPNPRK